MRGHFVGVFMISREGRRTHQCDYFPEIEKLDFGDIPLQGCFFQTSELTFLIEQIVLIALPLPIGGTMSCLLHLGPVKCRCSN